MATKTAPTKETQTITADEVAAIPASILASSPLSPSATETCTTSAVAAVMGSPHVSNMPEAEDHDEGEYAEPLAGMKYDGRDGSTAPLIDSSEYISEKQHFEHDVRLARANVAVAYLGTEYTSSGMQRMAVIHAAELLLLDFFKPDAKTE